MELHYFGFTADIEIAHHKSVNIIIYGSIYSENPAGR